MSLPSDEEIEVKLENRSHYFKGGNSFVEGAKWMRSLAEIEIAKLRTESDILIRHMQTRVDIEIELLERIKELENDLTKF